MGATLFSKQVQWLDGRGSQAEVVVATRATLSRNLADFSFPDRCTITERRTIEERVLGAMEQAGMLSRGRYFSSMQLETRDVRFLEERHLLPEGFDAISVHSGVYVSDDQCLSVVINGPDHIMVRALASGLDVDAVWRQVNAIDDTFLQAMDFSFDERRGFLTSRVDFVGTGLKMSVLLHLPAMARDSKVVGLDQRVREQRHVLSNAFGNGASGGGDFYLLSNQCTLGRSEQEIMFHLRHIANEIVSQEAEQRARTAAENLRALEDRVGRALGIARGARLLELAEALDILSALRLGVASTVLGGYTLKTVNELLLECQQGHLERKAGQDCDTLTLSAERAELFRARFA